MDQARTVGYWFLVITKSHESSRVIYITRQSFDSTVQGLAHCAF